MIGENAPNICVTKARTPWDFPISKVPTTLCMSISAQEIPTCCAHSAQIISTTLHAALGASAAASRKTAAEAQPNPANGARRNTRSDTFPMMRIVTTAKP